MARKSRHSNRKNGLLERIWAIPGGILSATGNSAGIVGKSVGNVARRTVKTVKNVGNTYAKKTNNAISKVVSRKRKGTRKNMRR